jgi:hypothetical protein
LFCFFFFFLFLFLCTSSLGDTQPGTW